MSGLQNIIESAFESIQTLTPLNAEKPLKEALQEILMGLEQGILRICTPKNNQDGENRQFEQIEQKNQKSEWETHQWLKKAILLYFRCTESAILEGGFSQFYDKIPMRFEPNQSNYFDKLKARIVPPASVRRGAYIGGNTVIMPSFVNIGAFIDSNTMVDTWATVGSCAQIGKNVHLSGGVGIGGVLEPLQATPTIIEDDCFIGARSEIVEGVIVEKGSVISMGVFIGQSTKIFNRETGEIIYGRVPRGSVVVPGSLPARDGSYSLNCAVIVKQVDEKTRAKTSLNELLRYDEK